jgi:hypothetical protein
MRRRRCVFRWLELNYVSSNKSCKLAWFSQGLCQKGQISLCTLLVIGIAFRWTPLLD